MVSGTLVLTGSIDNAFNFIFTSVRQGSDAVVSGKSPVDVTQGQGSFAPSLDQSLLDKVRGLSSVALAEGNVNGTATLIGHDGKAIVFGGAPNLGFSIAKGDSPFNPLVLVSGSWPGSGDVVIDQSTAKKKHFAMGDDIGVQAEGPVRHFKISGIVKFGSAASLGGATLSGFALPAREVCEIFTGYNAERMTLLGFEEVRVRHPQCRVDGAPTCRWELAWKGRESL